MFWCIVVIVILFFANIIIRKGVVNESSYIFIFWGVSILINKYGFVKYYELSENTYVVIAVGLTCYFAGVCFTFFFRKYRAEKLIESDYVNWQILYFFLILHMAYSVYLVIKMSNFIVKYHYTFAQLRSIYQGYESNVMLINNRIEELIHNWMFRPLPTVLLVVAICLILNRDYSHKSFYYILALDQVVFIITTQNRAHLFFVGMYLAIAFYFIKDQLSLKEKRKIVKILISVFIIITILTLIRFANSKTWRGFRSLFLYAGGGITLLDRGIRQVDALGVHTNGASFFYGLYVILYNIIHLLPIEESELFRFLNFIQAQKEVFLRIGEKVWFNAYYTFFYDFYLDGGMIAVAFESVLFGFISSRSIYMARKYTKDYWIVCNGLLMYIVFFMLMVRWQFVSPVFVFGYIYLFFIFKCKVNIKFIK